MESPTSPSRIKVIYAITKSNFGGAQRYVYDLARSLPKDRFNPIVLFGGNGPLKDKLERVGVPTMSIPYLDRDVALADIRAFFKVLSLFRKEHPDVVHLNSSKMGLMGGLAARIAKVPNILFTAHGWAFKEDRSIVEKIAIAILSWFTVTLSHTTIVVSKDDLDRSRWMPGVQRKIVHIANGIPLPRFMSPNVAREKLLGDRARALEDSLWIGTVAELTKNKGLKTAIDALAHLLAKKLKKNPILVIIGDGELRQDLEKHAETRGVRESVFFVGFKENASEYLKAFDIFILPSIKEGLPYALLEAGRALLPVVASHVGGIPEIITDMQSGILVPPGKAGELAKAIGFLADNRHYRMSFKNTLQESVKQNFSLEATVEKTITLYTHESAILK